MSEEKENGEAEGKAKGQTKRSKHGHLLLAPAPPTHCRADGPTWSLQSSTQAHANAGGGRAIRTGHRVRAGYLYVTCPCLCALSASPRREARRAAERAAEREEEKFYSDKIKIDYKASEGKLVNIPYKGRLEDTLLDLLGGVRSTCTYIGAKKIKDISKCTTFVCVNNQLNNYFN